jgi:protein associated with RNAse G/E
MRVQCVQELRASGPGRNYYEKLLCRVIYASGTALHLEWRCTAVVVLVEQTDTIVIIVSKRTDNIIIARNQSRPRVRFYASIVYVCSCYNYNSEYLSLRINAGGECMK